MLAAAAALAACLLLVAVVLPQQLSRAQWPTRDPGPALLLWQAVGLAGGLLVLSLSATLALASIGSTWGVGLRRLDRGLPAPAWLPVAVGLAVLLRLTWVLVASTVSTVRERRRNRLLVDLVADRNPLLRGTSVVDHDLPVAYCLPGLHPRLVLSRGTLALLSYDELTAVLAHERAHLDQRHDLVVLPFVALGTTFPRLPQVGLARTQVALLVELLADDRAARDHDRQALARALWKIGAGAAPRGALGVAGQDVLLRARRLVAAPDPLPTARRVAVLLAAALVAATPLLGPFLPLLV